MSHFSEVVATRIPVTLLKFDPREPGICRQAVVLLLWSDNHVRAQKVRRRRSRVGEGAALCIDDLHVPERLCRPRPVCAHFAFSRPPAVCQRIWNFLHSGFVGAYRLHDFRGRHDDHNWEAGRHLWRQKDAPH